MPFAYMLQSFHSRTLSSGGMNLRQIAENMVYLFYWLGPFTSVVFLGLIFERLKAWPRDWKVNVEDLLLAAGIFLVVGYTVVGGTNFGFPRYQSSGIALLFIYSGLRLSRISLNGISRRPALFVFLAALAIQILTLADPFYLLRFELRKALLISSPAAQEVLKRFALLNFFYFGSLLTAVLFCRKKWPELPVFFLLVLFSLGSNLAVDSFQNRGGYQTGYNYGTRHVLQAAQMIRGQTPADTRVLAPSEILYYLDRPAAKPYFDRQWNNPEELVRRLGDSEVAAFAYGVTTNPVEQIRRISGYAPLQEILGREFEYYQIGEFQIWIRKTT
jgi:hypothetical protein